MFLLSSDLAFDGAYGVISLFIKRNVGIGSQQERNM